MTVAAPKSDASTKNSVQSLAKAFRLLEAIAASESDMTLSELASAASLDPGTTHRMLKTMVDLGYVARVEGKRFTLTLKVLDLGFRAIGRRDMRTLARPILRSLVGEVSEAASLGVLQGAEVLYLERIRAGIMRLGVDIRVGTVIPVTSSVIGWAIMAFLSDAELDRVLARHDLAVGAVSPAERASLLQTLAEVRKQGYALAQSPISSGIAVLAVPVLDADNHAVAAISVTAPSIRMTPAELHARSAGSIQTAARELARGLEASGGASHD